MTDQSSRAISLSLTSHLPSAIVCLESLEKAIEKKDEIRIKGNNKYVEIELKQYRMRLKALSNF